MKKGSRLKRNACSTKFRKYSKNKIFNSKLSMNTGWVSGKVWQARMAVSATCKAEAT